MSRNFAKEVADRLQAVTVFCRQNGIFVNTNQNPWVALCDSKNIAAMRAAHQKLSNLDDNYQNKGEWAAHRVMDLVGEEAGEFCALCERLSNITLNNQLGYAEIFAGITLALIQNSPENTYFTPLFSKKIKENDGINVWYWLTRTLFLAAQLKRQMLVISVASSIQALAMRANSDILSELTCPRTYGEFMGITSWHWIAGALCNTSKQNDQVSVIAVTAAIQTITKRSDKSVFFCLSKKVDWGEFQNIAPWYWSMGAFCHAAHNDNQEMVSTICITLWTILNKMEPSALSILSQQKATGKFKGSTFWHWLGQALFWAVTHNNLGATIEIATLIQAFIQKSSLDNFLDLTKKIKFNGNISWETIFSTLSDALKFNSLQLITPVIAVIESIVYKLSPTNDTATLKNTLKAVGFTQALRDELALFVMREVQSLKTAAEKISWVLSIKEREGAETFFWKMLDTSFGMFSFSASKKINEMVANIYVTETQKKLEAIEALKNEEALDRARGRSDEILAWAILKKAEREQNAIAVKKTKASAQNARLFPSLPYNGDPSLVNGIGGIQSNEPFSPKN